MPLRGRFHAFLTELSRRRVGRVAAGYAVGAWLLVEVADTIFPRLLFPNWTVTAVIALALIGFPLAVLLAWWFDIVPDATSSPRRRWLVPLLVTAIVMLGAAFAATRVLPRIVDPDNVEAVVVLPFENASTQADEDYFVTGIYDEIIAQLSQVSSLRVISRRSAMHYRASRLSIPEIAQQLSVDAVVEGSVRRVGDQVQVRVALIRPLPRERQTWTHTFTVAERDILTLQSDAARNIAQQIRGQLTPAELRRLSETGAVDPETYKLYLRGLYYINNRSGRASIIEGLKYLQQAVDLNPADARTWAALANGYATLGHAWVYMPEAWSRARAAADRAINLDPELAHGYLALGKIKMYHEWDWPGAEHALRKALELNPSLAAAHYEYSFYLRLFDQQEQGIESMRRAQQLDPFTAPYTAWQAGDRKRNPEEAIALAKRAIDVAPNAASGWIVLGNAYGDAGRYAEAIESHERLISMAPLAKWMLGVTYAKAGRREDALRIAAELEAGAVTPFIAYGLGMIYVRLGDEERAFKWLNHGEAHAWLPWIRVYDVFEPLHDDARYQALLQRMRLPPN